MMQGVGCSQNETAAAEWMLKAAEQGDSRCVYMFLLVFFWNFISCTADLMNFPAGLRGHMEPFALRLEGCKR